MNSNPNVSLMSILKRMTAVTRDLENEIQANFSSSEYNPWTDIQTLDDGYRIELCISECKKDDISVHLTDDRVIVINTPNLSRSIYVPEDASLDDIKSYLENDEILVISIPKIQHNARNFRKIEVL